MKSNKEVYISGSQHDIDDPFGIFGSSAEVLAKAYEDAVMDEFCDETSAPQQWEALASCTHDVVTRLYRATNIPNVPKLQRRDLDVNETVAHARQTSTTRARDNAETVQTRSRSRGDNLEGVTDPLHETYRRQPRHDAVPSAEVGNRLTDRPGMSSHRVHVVSPVRSSLEQPKTSSASRGTIDRFPDDINFAYRYWLIQPQAP